jgi:uroporphyrinogen-III synthase
MPSSLNSKILAITRNNLEAQEFSDLIASEGGRAIPLPTIEIVPKDSSAVDEFINAVNKNENEYCLDMRAEFAKLMNSFPC